MKAFQAPLSGKYHFYVKLIIKISLRTFFIYFRLKDVVIEHKQLYLIFEYLDKDLKAYMEGLGPKML